MEVGKYYSVKDLANLINQPNTVITESMQFLAKYGFVKGFAREEIFTKTGKLSPAKSAQLLGNMLQPSIGSVRSSPAARLLSTRNIEPRKW